MDITGKIAIVTGGGQGIGAALAQALHQAGAKHVCVSDLNGDNAKQVAQSIGGTGLMVDVRDADQITAMIEQIETDHGPVDLMCSNAGIANGFDPDIANAAGASPQEWQLAWEVNVMAHIHAANILFPRMIARGGGHFLHTVSAAGLWTQIGSATYSTTKHAAVGFAENLAISHRDQGIRVSILCPQGVATPMLSGIGGDGPQAGDGVLTAEAVAQSALDGIRNQDFLILPHPQVQAYIEAKAANYNRWIGGMAKFQRQFKP